MTDTMTARPVPAALRMVPWAVAAGLGLAGIALQSVTYLNHDVSWVLWSSGRLLDGGVFGREPQAAALAAAFERQWAALATTAAGLPRQRVLYLIWQKPWLGVARDTYISRMLAAAGWDTLPVESRDRYPAVDLATLAGEAELVLLSSEPYPFREQHLRRLADAAPDARAALIDGEMVSWYGSRAIRGLAYLRRLRASLAQSPGT